MSNAANMIPAMSDAQATIIAALLAAAFASAGYVLKLAIDSIRAAMERRDARFAKLVELDGLLRASRAVYENQNALAARLESSIQVNRSDLVVTPLTSYESTFVAAYAGMTESERAIHGVIRSMTEHATKPLNQRMLEWLQQDAYWKAHTRHSDARGELALSLSELEAHLFLWHAKYAYWMTEPLHSLVYLADEEAHGVGFPKRLEVHVEAILARTGKGRRKELVPNVSEDVVEQSPASQ